MLCNENEWNWQQLMRIHRHKHNTLNIADNTYNLLICRRRIAPEIRFSAKAFQTKRTISKAEHLFFCSIHFFVVLCRMLGFPLVFFIFHSLGYRILNLFVRYTFCCRLMLLLNTKWTRTCWSKKKKNNKKSYRSSHFTVYKTLCQWTQWCICNDQTIQCSWNEAK